MRRFRGTRFRRRPSDRKHPQFLLLIRWCNAAFILEPLFIPSTTSFTLTMKETRDSNVLIRRRHRAATQTRSVDPRSLTPHNAYSYAVEDLTHTSGRGLSVRLTAVVFSEQNWYGYIARI